METIMHPKTQEKIEKDIRTLPETLEITIERQRRKPLVTGERARQRKFLAGLQSKISTSSVYIEKDDYLITIKLKNKVYSSKFIQLKSAFERIIAQHQNEFNATHDSLTEIYNRNGFETELKKQKSNTITYCIADIDNFKQINDSNSHEFGDSVLQDFSTKLKTACIAASEKHCAKILFSRYGGEEFVIAILSESLNTEIPEEIRRQTRGSIDGVEFRASLGFTHSTVYPTSKPALQKLYKEADAALYKSKREGKDRTTKFSAIRENLGKIIEADENYGVITIDIGSNTGVTLSDSFDVYPHKYSGMEKFIIDDGRSKKPIGTYPKIKIGNIVPFNVQEEISFCRVREGTVSDIVTGSRLSLCADEYSETLDNLLQQDE